MADELSIAQVEFVWNGDFCSADCEWLNHDLTYCIMHSEQLKTHKIAVDPMFEYVSGSRKKEPFEAPLRCKGCLENQPSCGLYRKLTARGKVRVFPSPEQIVKGEWVPCEQLVDFRDTLKGWSVRCTYGWHLLEEDNVNICDVTFDVRKGARGKVRNIGTAQGLFHLDELPTAARLPFMIWTSALYNEVVDIEEAQVDALWEEQKEQAGG